jgi:UDP-N-acetylglucosamine 2-epimerase (non-hydrolysing)
MSQPEAAHPAPLRVAVFVGTRADLGPLWSVIAALEAAPDLEPQVLTGVAYGTHELASALPPAADAGWGDRVHQLAPRMEAVGADDLLRHGPRLAEGMGALLAHEPFDVLVVLGDRWELLYAVPPAFLAAVPIVHLHGGEVTEGAVDERVRHSVSKLADQHCVASADAARRLAQMGEPPERIHVTGAPGLDRIATAEPLDDEELSQVLGVEVRRPVALFTYHPPTADADAPVGRWVGDALAGTLDHCGTVIATYPGMDTGREAIIATLRRAELDPRVVLVEALGAAYPRVLASVDVVVGNSSSGLIEAASTHTPAVNVGKRQRGRLRGANVVDAAEGRDAVSAAVGRALSPEMAGIAARTDNPYGRGDASRRILDIVRAAPQSPRAKRFVDITEERS